MKATLRKILCTLSALVMMLSLLTVSAYAASSPKISKTSAEIPAGYYITLKVSGTDKNVTWYSGNTGIATVKSSKDNSAKVTGKKAGTTYIYAKTAGKTLKCKVTVKASVISASKDTVEMKTGTSETITLTVKGSKNVVMSNSDKSVCTASWGKWNGSNISLTLNAKKAGTAKIKVYIKGQNSSTAKTITVKVGSESEISSNTSNMAADVVLLTNSEREKYGLAALKKDDTLNKIAETRVKEITASFSHLRPDGDDCFSAFEEMGIKNVYMGENLAMGQKSSSSVMSAWMKSSGHKANILSSEFKRVGVACAESGGMYYWVQVFSGDF